MATSDSNIRDDPDDGTRLPPLCVYEQSSPSGEVLLRHSDHAMGDSLQGEVVKLSKDEYMELMGEIRGLRKELDTTNEKLRNQSQVASDSDCYRRSSNEDSGTDRADRHETEVASSNHTPIASVERSESARDHFRHSSYDTHIIGRNRVSFPDRRRLYDALEYGRDSRHDEPVVRQNSSDHTPRKYKQPATYDGRNSWRDYFVHFEMVSELNQWDETTRAMELAVSLRGSAQGVLSDLRPEQRRNYRSLVLALSSRFEPENQAELHRAQLKNRVRNKGEALTELAQDIKRLTRMSYPQASPEIREQLAKEGFLDALCDTDLEWAVHQGKPNAVDEAVCLALEFEAFQDGRKKRVNFKPNKPVVRAQCEAPTAVNRQEDVLKDILKRINQLESTKTPKSEDTRVRVQEGRRKCTYCNRDGHIVEDCFTKARDERNYKGRQPDKNAKMPYKNGTGNYRNQENCQ
ncbi:MAG: hypothetical protein ABW185_28200 [Sedimenticola sp.]